MSIATDTYIVASELRLGLAWKSGLLVEARSSTEVEVEVVVTVDEDVTGDRDDCEFVVIGEDAGVGALKYHDGCSGSPPFDATVA